MGKLEKSKNYKDLIEVFITNQGPKRRFQFFNFFPFIQIWCTNICLLYTSDAADEQYIV